MNCVAIGLITVAAPTGPGSRSSPIASRTQRMSRRVVCMAARIPCARAFCLTEIATGEAHRQSEPSPRPRHRARAALICVKVVKAGGGSIRHSTADLECMERCYNCPGCREVAFMVVQRQPDVLQCLHCGCVWEFEPPSPDAEAHLLRVAGTAEGCVGRIATRPD